MAQKSTSFFDENSYAPFHDLEAFSQEISWFSDIGVELLSRADADALNHAQFFDTIISDNERTTQIDALPKLDPDVHHVLIPFCYEDHDEVQFGDMTLESFIQSSLNRVLRGNMYLLSCDPTLFVALKFKSFDYDIIHTARTVYINSHFILFNEERSLCAAFCAETPFVVISQPRAYLQEGDFFGKSKRFWDAYFQEQYPEASKNCGQAFLQFVEKTYFPRVFD